MKSSLKTGFSFGLTSGIITTLGLITGLHSGTHSKSVVVAGILTIAIADAFSDALGIHISEESRNNHEKYIWESTFSTFLSKFIFALIFIIPVLLLELTTAIIASIVIGLSLLSLLSFYIAKERKTNPSKAVIEHLLIASLVITITHFVGDLLSTLMV